MKLLKDDTRKIFLLELRRVIYFFAMNLQPAVYNTTNYKKNMLIKCKKNITGTIPIKISDFIDNLILMTMRCLFTITMAN